MSTEIGYIRVVSMRKVAPMLSRYTIPGEVRIRADRAHPVLGNPHVMIEQSDDDERARVIAAFIADAEKDMANDGPISKEIDALAARVRAGERIALACWCTPKDCHLNWIAQRVTQRAYAGIGAKALYAAIAPYLIAGEAASVLQMPTKKERSEYVKRVALRRGADQATALRQTVEMMFRDIKNNNTAEVADEPDNQLPLI